MPINEKYYILVIIIKYIILKPIYLFLCSEYKINLFI